MTKYISTKELYTNLKPVSEDVMNGVTYVVLKYSKPAYKIVPIEDMNNNKYTADDLEEFTFTGKNKNGDNLATTYKKNLYK